MLEITVKKKGSVDINFALVVQQNSSRDFHILDRSCIYYKHYDIHFTAKAKPLFTIFCSQLFNHFLSSCDSIQTNMNRDLLKCSK